jgi:hypothetical protein
MFTVARYSSLMQNLTIMTQVVKRKLRQEKSSNDSRDELTPEERIDAVETINRLKESIYAEQTFPRVHRVTRKARR